MIQQLFSWLRSSKPAPAEPAGPCPLCGQPPNEGVSFYDGHCEPCWKKAVLDHPEWGVTCKRCARREPCFRSAESIKLGRCYSCLLHCPDCDGNTAGFGAPCRCVELGKRGFTCSKCRQALEDYCRSRSNPDWCARCSLVLCKTCQSQGYNCEAYDRELMLCEIHLLAQHPSRGHTCTSCREVVLKVVGGLCESCISKKSHKICKRCGELARIKHNSICWACWND